MKRSPSPWLVILAAVVLLVINGCGATPIERWETSMAVYTAANNTVAAAVDDGRLKVDDAKSYREAARIARASLDAWLLTISADGRTDDGASRAVAQAALAEIRKWLARTLTKG